MDATGTTSHSPFDKLFTRNVPHIYEKIFLSLDYYSFKSCLMVNKKWNQVLTSESFQKMGKSSFNVWLIYAAMYGHRDMVQLLLRLGAEADKGLYTYDVSKNFELSDPLLLVCSWY